MYRLLPAAAEPLRSLALGGVLGIVGFLLGGLTQYNFGDAEVVIVLWATAGVVMRVGEWAGKWTRESGSCGGAKHWPAGHWSGSSVL